MIQSTVGIQWPAGAREGSKSGAGDVRVTLGPVGSVVHGSWHGSRAKLIKTCHVYGALLAEGSAPAARCHPDAV